MARDSARRPSQVIYLFDEPWATAYDKAVSMKLWAFENDLENKRTEAIVKTMVNLWSTGEEEREPTLQGRKIETFSEEELAKIAKPKVMGQAKVKDGKLVDYFDEHGIEVSRI